MNTALPIRGKNRLEWIDAARGFAVFGIFIVNIGSFSAPYFLYGGGDRVWNEPVDSFIRIIIDIFFQASFYTLFSLLFGFGYQIMSERLRAKNISLYPFLIRRMSILFGFGLIHAFVIWYGDILLTYSVVGFILLLFINVRSKYLLWVAVILLGSSVSFITFVYYIARDYLGVSNQAAINEAFANYQSRNFFLIWEQNYTDWMYANGGIGIIFLVMTILPLFLIGMYIARKRLLHEPENYRAILWKIWSVSFVIFILLKMGPYLFDNPPWFSYIQDNVGGGASAIFYIVSMTLLAQSNRGKRMTRAFTYVGRMALTSYITQSIFLFLLSYGIGLYGSISPLVGIIIVILFYSLQVLFSKWWFMRYQFGPLEWVWRSLTYWKRQPFKRS
ncbi:DUF418 domain-containing protein [Oceanobacillus piezotolerans]|uniref:DUF418 domain-containing protein n=1 Tax=Oceanobacillus piezotolerans TaxID=2448030 RepID=A0A498DBD2_9BACI|nr:DUF418 domain-containing protein [Oceanobacillus piezotolerans]RLL45043.1 DUF418 domain-containing protein [Oceanobacillus piezotolerans]